VERRRRVLRHRVADGDLVVSGNGIAAGASALAGKRVLVTGASGFLGRALFPRLHAQGARLRGFMRTAPLSFESEAETEIRLGDIADAAAVREAVRGVAAVVHLAALASVPDSLRDPAPFFRTNVAGTFNLLDACRNSGVERLVYVSSSQVYGPPRGGAIAEDHPLEPATPYAGSKAAAEMLVRCHQRAYGLATVILRPFNIYGPGQSRAALIPTIVTQALEGGDLRLGRVDITRDLTFVADVADAIVRALASPAAVGGTFNIGSGRGVTVGALAQTILDQIGSRAAILSDAGRIRGHESAGEAVIANADLAAVRLDWRASTTLEEGLRRTVAAYRNDHR
jgi:nucleoside-diphosphate-sugar epimerase